MVRRKLHLYPILALLVRTRHNRRITDEDIDFRDEGVDLFCCCADGFLGCEIDGNEGYLDGGMEGLDFSDQRLDFGEGAAG